ncbi:hypothetical protein K458DRAFT_296805 [Lentithecium fluviatile CBS 122367]|uniref:Uncharacterized protein n=1 Tax=Lentithecium fluviatile CBS 122367 TaxID=1168545 RepID=A0A6G1J9E1_9PLEO|nr:hypothetical protein K458DRAFT_296805 [Lentithecium fluviatile CBS 122367]
MLPLLSKDAYVLAYRYRELMLAKPKRLREDCNPYYENLLANLPDPPEDARDARSRSIRYAKEHYESFYEVTHIKMIVEWLDRNETQ